MSTEGEGQASAEVGREEVETPPELPGDAAESEQPAPPTVGSYTWEDFKREFYYDEDGEPPTSWRGRVQEFDPTSYLGFDPDDLPSLLDLGRQNASKADFFLDFISTPVTRGEYTWTHFKYEFYLTDAGELPTDDEDEVIPFDAGEWLGFHPEETEEKLADGASAAAALRDVVAERTVNVDPDVDEDDFFSTFEGHTTVVNRYDLEKAVPLAKKRHFREIDRYWVNKPYAFVIIFHSEKENEKKYYLVEPYANAIESDLLEFLAGKLRTAIKYASEDVIATTDEEDRAAVIERETMRLLERYDLYVEGDDSDGFFEGVGEWLDGLDDDGLTGSLKARLAPLFEQSDRQEADGPLDGIAARPEPAVLADDEEALTAYQVEKLLYHLERDFIGYERIDGIKHDVHVEDISCDGYESPVFVYHTDYEQVITNVFHGTSELDNFVVKLAQRSGKGISKRQPQVDATLPDGSRAQLTLGREVSDHGTNYTIRQFKDVPFTPIDLVNWHTFSLEEMALLWLCIENHKSLIFAGGTASGKTTSLNAVSLFIPSNTKIVSIEDTREVELPQRNWIASVTRPSFVEDGTGDVDEFDLLEAALRQRPDYIVMGEIRGEEGRTLFQVMSTGHTTYTTFHADSVGEVLKRFTTDPINVSKTMFTALDLVSIQASTRVQGTKVRRNKSLTEINHYDAENDEINVRDVYEWRAETDEFVDVGNSNTLEEIKFDRGWDEEELREELFKREVVLAYLIRENLNEYGQVAATLQAFINDPNTILGLIATDRLEASLEDLREMESVLIDVDPEKEKMVPRPDPNDRAYERAGKILEAAEERLFEKYRDAPSGSVSTALAVFDDERVGPRERSTPRSEAGATADLSGFDSPPADEEVDELDPESNDGDLSIDDLFAEPDPDGVGHSDEGGDVDEGGHGDGDGDGPVDVEGNEPVDGDDGGYADVEGDEDVDGPGDEDVDGPDDGLASGVVEEDVEVGENGDATGIDRTGTDEVGTDEFDQADGSGFTEEPSLAVEPGTELPDEGHFDVDRDDREDEPVREGDDLELPATDDEFDGEHEVDEDDAFGGFESVQFEEDGRADADDEESEADDEAETGGS